MPASRTGVASRRRAPASTTPPVKRERKAQAAASGDPASLRNQVKAFKREQILRVATELFYQQGYQRTSLDAVARRLGVTKPFIYYHFRDKAEILFEISRRGITRGNDVLRAALAEAGPVAPRLHAAVIEIVHTIIDAQRYTAIFFREQKNFDARIRAPLEAMHREFDDLLARLLQQGVAGGEFRIADVRLCSLAIGGMLNWAYTWYRQSGRLSVDALARGMADLALQTAGAAAAAMPSPAPAASAP